MLYVLLAVQIVTLIALFVVLLRSRPQPTQAAQDDPRLSQLLAADLPGQFARLDARSEVLDQHLRSELSQLRNDSRVANEGLRQEILTNISTLGDTLRANLEGFRGDNTAAAERLRLAIDAQMNTLAQRLTAFTADANSLSRESREALHTRLTELGAAQTTHQEKLRVAVEARLDALNVSNAAKLEEMRQTVDEKLHTTLHNRLNESFGQVTDQLTKVHAGLGEMTKLSAGVDDLSRIFTNVKSRGGIGELALEMLLNDRLAPSQYIRNAKVKPNSQEMVEFAVKFPTPNGEMLLPIDSKFPREIFERLEKAYESGTDIVSAGKAFEAAIRFEGKKICEKYISVPATTSFAIMFLPTESLYAEVIRRDGLMADIQQNCRVTIAGPSTLAAILTSFQMGFQMLQLQQKGDEVWKVLSGAQKEFGNLGILMTKMEKQVDTVQNTIQDVGRRTRAINRTLTHVSLETAKLETAKLETAQLDGEFSASMVGLQTGFDGLLPALAASEEEDE